MSTQLLPDRLGWWICRALIGEVYPEIRAIAVGWSADKELTIRYYLDREPTEDDYESLGVVVANVLANTSSNADIVSVREECLFEKGKLGILDPLCGFVYARKENIASE